MSVIGSQLVGLNVNPGRLTVTFTCLICNGIPSIIVGILYGPVLSLETVSCVVTGFTSILARTTTGLPSCNTNGPAFAGFTIDSPNGAPSYGPVIYTLPPVTVNGSSPKPTLTVVSPIKLSAPHVPASACASPHSFTPGKSPESPGGHLQRHRLQALLAVFAAHRDRQRRQPTRLDVRRTRRQSRPERQRRTAFRAPTRPRGDLEARGRHGDFTGAGGSAADHGVNTDVVVYVPHNAGVANGALAVPKNSSFTSLTGNCGISSNVVVNWPVSAFGSTLPRELDEDPLAGSSATRYIAIKLPNGFSNAPRSSAAPPNTPSLPVRLPTTVS